MKASLYRYICAAALTAVAMAGFTACDDYNPEETLKENYGDYEFKFSDKEYQVNVYSRNFNFPFEGGEGSEYRLRVAVDEQCELSPRNLPTGKTLPLDEQFAKLRGEGLQTTDCAPIEAGFTLREIEVDGKKFRGAVVEHLTTGRKVFYEVDDETRYWTIWNNGGNQPYCCPEPQSWITNAPNAADPETAGFRAIKPGKSWSATYRLYAEYLAGMQQPLQAAEQMNYAVSLEPSERNNWLFQAQMYVNAGDEPIADYNDKSLFKEITATDNIILETDTDKYLPNGAELDGTKFDAYTIGGTDTEGYFKAEMLAKVYMELTDVSSNAETSVVYLDWYVNDGYKINLADKADNASFIAVAKDKLGATYNYNGAYSMTWEQLKDEYQAQVNEAAKNLSAGSSSYMYLPSPEKLFADNATPYKDMRYGIYFYHKTQQSNTSLAYSNLSINISQPGEYVFTVYATDAASNNMYYLKALEGDKEKGKKYINIDGKDYEIVEFASSEIWNMFKDEDEEGLADYLPWFRFEVGYTGVTFEETPGLQSTAYVGTKYTSASFKINGITGSYDVTYRLFLFDRAAYYNGEGKTLTYQEFVDNMSALYGDASTQKYFKEIPALADMEETDEEYELYKDYGWDKGSTSFTPQDNNAFYMIRAEVTDKHMVSEPVTCELGVVASVTAKSLKGESDWLKNNVVSVVLLSIAGAALIGIVLLLVIKPKDKGDIDERFENAKKKSAKKNKK